MHVVQSQKIKVLGGRQYVKILFQAGDICCQNVISVLKEHFAPDSPLLKAHESLDQIYQITTISDPV